MRFQELIGEDLQNRKNQYEKSANYQLLTPHTKIKVQIYWSKLNWFSIDCFFYWFSFPEVYSLIDEHVLSRPMNWFVHWTKMAFLMEFRLVWR